MVSRQLSQSARGPNLRSENGGMLCCFGEFYCGPSRFWQGCEYRGMSWNFQTMMCPVYRSWARELVRAGWRYLSHWKRSNGPISWGFHMGINCHQWFVPPPPMFSGYVNVWFLFVGIFEGQLRSYLNEKSSGSRSRKQRLTAVGTRCADHVTPLYPQKLALFADRRRPLCRYSSRAD